MISIKEPGEEGKRDANAYRALLALAAATGYSVHAHVPRHAILARISRDRRGMLKKCLKTIERQGLASRHPTRGETTWQLTVMGLKATGCLAGGVQNDISKRLAQEAT